ncbi:MAG: M48 family metalloprotease [Cyclobacteriaceae bacterium]
MRRLFLSIFLIQALPSFAQDVSKDTKLGAEAAVQVELEMGLYDHDSLYKLVNEVGTKLVSRLSKNQFDFQFFLVDSAEPNAFALPGGYVYVTRGILPLVQTEDELAGIMAHEIIHVTERHSIKQMKKGVVSSILKVPGNIINAVTGTQLGNVLNAPINFSEKAFIAQYSQKHEKDADLFGIQLAASAGYQTDALANALETLSEEVEVLTGEKEKQNYFSDHPYTPTRVTSIRSAASRYAPVSSAPVASSNEIFLNKFEGLVFGHNPQQGVFRDTLFLHPDLRLAWIIPSKWTAVNQPNVVAAYSEKGDGMVSMRLAGSGQSLDEMLATIREKIKENEKAGKIKIDFMGDTVINRLPSHLFRIKSRESNNEVLMNLALVPYRDVVLQFVGVSTSKLGKLMSHSLTSFREARDEEVASLDIYRISLIAAKGGETLGSISSRAENKLNNEMTAIINKLSPDEKLKEGEVVKVVKASPYLSSLR